MFSQTFFYFEIWLLNWKPQYCFRLLEQQNFVAERESQWFFCKPWRGTVYLSAIAEDLACEVISMRLGCLCIHSEKCILKESSFHWFKYLQEN